MVSIGLVYSNHDNPSGTSKRIRLQQSGESIILTFNEHKLNTVEILEMVEKSRELNMLLLQQTVLNER
jgi:hypothetical protein